jgi:phage FluMu protein Com
VFLRAPSQNLPRRPLNRHRLSDILSATYDVGSAIHQDSAGREFVAEPREKTKKPKVFRGMSEVAVKIVQPLDIIGVAPEHELFKDDKGHVRIEMCVRCGAEYLIAFSRIYRTKRTFEELSNQLQLRLEQDHRARCDHGPVIPLRRKPQRENTGLFWAAKCKKCGKQAAVRPSRSTGTHLELGNPSEKIKLVCPHCYAVNDFLGSDFEEVQAYIRRSQPKS